MFCTTFVRSRQSMQFVRNTPVCVAAGGESPIWKKYLAERKHTGMSIRQKKGGSEKKRRDKPHLFVFIPEHRVHDRDLVVTVIATVVVEVKVEVPHRGVVQQRDVATEHRRQRAFFASGVDEIDHNHATVLLHKRGKVVTEPKCLVCHHS